MHWLFHYRCDVYGVGAHMMGSTSEYIVLTGDSAGGNLVLTVALRVCGLLTLAGRRLATQAERAKRLFTSPRPRALCTYTHCARTHNRASQQRSSPGIATQSQRRSECSFSLPSSPRRAPSISHALTHIFAHRHTTHARTHTHTHTHTHTNTNANTKQCLQEGVKLPHSLHPTYPVLHCQFVPSASRLLATMDGMLPFGPLLQCFTAYVPEEVLSVNYVAFAEMLGPSRCLCARPLSLRPTHVRTFLSVIGGQGQGNATHTTCAPFFR